MNDFEIVIRFFTAMFCVIYTLTLNYFNSKLYYITLTFWCFYEYHYQIESTRKKITIVLSCAMYLIVISNTDNVIILPMLMSLFAVELFSGSANPMLSLGTDLIGLVWIGIPMYLCVELNNNDPRIVYGVMIFVFFSDTGAYFTGRYLTKYIGEHKLMPTVSPKKTCEGLVGGALLALMCWYPIQKYFTILSPFNWLIIYFISVIMGAIGDLVESRFKRDLKIKDTGNVLPGAHV